MIELHGRKIERALIVDDDPQARDAYKYVIEDMGLRPCKVSGPLDDLSAFIGSIEPNDVVLCDFHLKKKSYASCDGDQLTAQCFRARVPSALCTTIENAPIRRDYLRYIPGLLDTGTPDPSELHLAWQKCALELDGRFEPARRPWRTLVRIADIDDDHTCVYAVVPAWDVHRKVRIDKDNLPPGIRKLVEPDRRFHALVNTGATSHRELFFDDWEAE